MRMLRCCSSSTMILLSTSPTIATSSRAALISLSNQSFFSLSRRGARCHHSLLSSNSTTPFGSLIREQQRPWSNSAIRCRTMESAGSGFDFAANGGNPCAHRTIQFALIEASDSSLLYHDSRRGMWSST